MLLMKPLSYLLLALLVLVITSASVQADLRAPAWYDQNAVGTTPDWHYRVPINIPAGAAINSTIKVDVDFAALLTQLGVSGTFDANSPRVVRSSGALSTLQQYTDTVYAGATDATGNSRGEVRFILQDAGAVTYYLYFDITANGAKPANPQTPINGNFEFGGAGTMSPPGWTATSTSANFDAQIRPNENLSVTNVGNNTLVANTDGTPYSGAFSYLLGGRTRGVPAGSPGVTLTKTFTKPAVCTSGLSLRYRPEGFDSSWNNATQYDFIRVTVGTTVIVGPNGPPYATLPYSPNYSSNSNNAQQSAGQSGWGPYNNFDSTSTGTHTLGMTLARGAQPWFAATNSLASFASGATVTLTITSTHDAADKSWFHIDDVEWCVVTPTLGTPEGFGVNITAPTAATTYTGGQKLVIRAQVDAAPTAATTPVTANLYDNAGALLVSGIVLYNDGTHGDAATNDAIWSNDGSIAANPTYTFPGGVVSGSNWKVRVFAKDASTSSIAASNGLIHITGQANSPETQTTFHNIDEQTFAVQTPALVMLKSVTVTSDPVNGTSNPKSIPGANELYTLQLSNQGTGTVDNSSVTVVDMVPANTMLYVGDLGGAGSGPALFTNGSPSSTLTWTFISLVSNTDDIDFSNDGGGSWNYTPTPNAQGFDAAVTHVRLKPKGTMAANTGSGNPSFQVRLRVQVK